MLFYSRAVQNLQQACTKILLATLYLAAQTVSSRSSMQHYARAIFSRDIVLACKYNRRFFMRVLKCVLRYITMPRTGVQSLLFATLEDCITTGIQRHIMQAKTWFVGIHF